MIFYYTYDLICKPYLFWMNIDLQIYSSNISYWLLFVYIGHDLYAVIMTAI